MSDENIRTPEPGKLKRIMFATSAPFLPVGTIMDIPSHTPTPAGWVEPIGQTVLVSEFPELFNVIGYRYSLHQPFIFRKATLQERWYQWKGKFIKEPNALHNPIVFTLPDLSGRIASLNPKTEMKMLDKIYDFFRLNAERERPTKDEYFRLRGYRSLIPPATSLVAFFILGVLLVILFSYVAHDGKIDDKQWTCGLYRNDQANALFKDRRVLTGKIVWNSDQPIHLCWTDAVIPGVTYQGQRYIAMEKYKP